MQSLAGLLTTPYNANAHHLPAEDVRLPTSTVALVTSHLLLLRLLSLLLRLLPLLPNPHKPRITPRPPQLRIRILIPLRHIPLLHLLDTKLHARTGLNTHPRHSQFANDVLGVLGGGDVGFLGVEGFVLPGFAGEEDQAGLVGLEAGDVEGEGFFGGGASAGVDGDADCGGEFAGDAGFLLNFISCVSR
jgi:hypothetical protein